MYRPLSFCLWVLLSLSFALAIASPSNIMEKGGGSGSGSGGGRGASGRGRGLSGGTGRAAISYPVINTGGRVSNYFSEGGGKPLTLAAPSRFAGREMGGGSRSDVAGTRSYASGYISSNGREGSVVGRALPFGFWPLYWFGHGQSDEYGGSQDIDHERLGGGQVIVQLAPNATAASYNVSAVNGINETYWMVGDKESVTTMLSLLVDTDSEEFSPYGYGVLNNTILPFNSTNSTIRFSHVIQWYRASSFALAYEGYSNTFAFPPLNETSGVGWNASTPLPEQQVYSPFLRCVNNTLSTGLPILDADEDKLNVLGLVLGLVLGIFVGIPLFCYVVYRIRRCRRADAQRW